MKILLVEDDLMLSKALKNALQNEGFSVVAQLEGLRVPEAVFDFEPDLVILDLGLPDIDGVSVLQKIRETSLELPVLILTARDTVYDKVDALDKGADDYLSKPFDMQELLARIRVLARRVGIAASNTLSIGGLSMDTASQTVKHADIEVSLTQKEFLILKSLMQSVGRVQTKEMIERKLYDWSEEVNSNTIEVHISNLRKKIPSALIKTIRGVGYTIEMSKV